jgi:hypothetical protein
MTLNASLLRVEMCWWHLLSAPLVTGGEMKLIVMRNSDVIGVIVVMSRRR